VPRGGTGFLDQALSSGGRWSLSLSLLRSYDYQFSHPDSTGVSEAGEVFDVPQHEHSVALDVNRLELNLQYSFHANGALRLQLPYEQKNQRAHITPIENLSQEQMTAAERAAALHHQTDRFDGFSDAFLRLAWQVPGLLADHDQLILNLGTSLPLGDTAEDPARSQDSGPHNLLQFGNGTYDPLLDVSYYLPLGTVYELTLSGFARIPGDTNDEGFRGARQVNWRTALSRNWQDLRLTVSMSGLHSGYARWNGVRDENSGQDAYDASLGVTYTRSGHNISAGLTIPTSQTNRSPIGRTFDKGPTIYVGYALPL